MNSSARSGLRGSGRRLSWSWPCRAGLLVIGLILPACSSSGSGGESSGNSGLPGAFSLLSPANGNPSVSTGASFTWEASAGAASYTFQMTTDVDFTAFVLNQSDLPVTSFGPDTPLVTGRTYYWRVLAVNGDGTTVSSGRPWSFSTQLVLGSPGPFMLSSPANGTTVQLSIEINLGLFFSWTPSNGAVSYTLEVATDRNFMNLLASQTGVTGALSAPVLGLQPGMTYYWRAYAVDSVGSTLATDAPWSFQTASVITGSPAPTRSINPKGG